MTIAEKIFAEVSALPELQAWEVLEFVAFLKFRRDGSQHNQQDTSVFDRFGAVYEGPTRRDELYDRKLLGQLCRVP